MHVDSQRADEWSGKVIGAAMEVYSKKNGIKRMILPGANQK